MLVATRRLALATTAKLRKRAASCESVVESADRGLRGDRRDPRSRVSVVYTDEDRVNSVKFKILTVTERKDEHQAEFAKDYLKIKELALQEKQLKAIAKWQEQKIKDTFIKINGEQRQCEFNSNWLKTEKE